MARWTTTLHSNDWGNLQKGDFVLWMTPLSFHSVLNKTKQHLSHLLLCLSSTSLFSSSSFFRRSSSSLLSRSRSVRLLMWRPNLGEKDNTKKTKVNWCLVTLWTKAKPRQHFQHMWKPRGAQQSTYTCTVHRNWDTLGSDCALFGKKPADIIAYCQCKF